MGTVWGDVRGAPAGPVDELLHAFAVQAPDAVEAHQAGLTPRRRPRVAAQVWIHTDLRGGEVWGTRTGRGRGGSGVGSKLSADDAKATGANFKQEISNKIHPGMRVKLQFCHCFYFRQPAIIVWDFFFNIVQFYFVFILNSACFN